MSAFLYEKEDVVDMIHDTLTYHDLLEIKKEEGIEQLLKCFITSHGKKGQPQSGILERV